MEGSGNCSQAPPSRASQLAPQAQLMGAGSSHIPLLTPGSVFKAAATDYKQLWARQQSLHINHSALQLKAANITLLILCYILESSNNSKLQTDRATKPAS